MSSTPTPPNNGHDWRERMDRAEQSFNARIDRLTERHEALAQSMELAQHDWQLRWSETQTMLARVVGLIEQLGHIAQDHKHRLEDLESGR